MSNNKNIFLLEQVSFKFASHQPYFFKNVSLALEAGMHYFVCGKNGVGKSTFFRIILGDIGEQEYCSGRLKIHDISFDMQLDTSYRKYVRLLQQDVDTMLADMLTVKENLQCALLARLPGLGRLPDIIGSDLLVACGINLDQQVASLSGGQKQILAIIMALQKPTYLLLLDEPTAALDTNNALKVMEFLQKIALERNLVVIIISHDTELMAKYVYGERYIVIEEQQGVREVRYTPKAK